MKSDAAPQRNHDGKGSTSAYEYWLHPCRYRTQLCNDGAKCTRSVCFFAHSLEELREPVPAGDVPTTSKSSTRSTSPTASANTAKGARRQQLQAQKQQKQQSHAARNVGLALAAEVQQQQQPRRAGHLSASGPQRHSFDQLPLVASSESPLQLRQTSLQLPSGYFRSPSLSSSSHEDSLTSVASDLDAATSYLHQLLFEQQQLHQQLPSQLTLSSLLGSLALAPAPPATPQDNAFLQQPPLTAERPGSAAPPNFIHWASGAPATATPHGCHHGDLMSALVPSSPSLSTPGNPVGLVDAPPLPLQQLEIARMMQQYAAPQQQVVNDACQRLEVAKVLQQCCTTSSADLPFNNAPAANMSRQQQPPPLQHPSPPQLPNRYVAAAYHCRRASQQQQQQQQLFVPPPQQAQTALPMAEMYLPAQAPLFPMSAVMMNDGRMAYLTQQQQLQQQLPALQAAAQFAGADHTSMAGLFDAQLQLLLLQQQHQAALLPLQQWVPSNQPPASTSLHGASSAATAMSLMAGTQRMAVYL